MNFLKIDFPQNESKSCKLPVWVFTAGPDLRLNTPSWVLLLNINNLIRKNASGRIRLLNCSIRE
jgi:hypothetical protein